MASLALAFFMKRLTRFSIALVLVLVTGFATLYFTAPPLLNTPFSQAVYDEHHQLLRLTLTQDEKYRLFVPLNEISPQLTEATLLEEDQYFRWHWGINPISFIKAIRLTYFVHARRVGGSTITMQLARIRFNIHSKTIPGKLLQIFRAIQLEVRYSKNQILEAYLNLAPYGNNVEGVGAASLVYFGIPVNKLSLSQALTLAVIPQNPIQRTSVQPKLKEIRNKLFTRWIVKHPEDRNQSAMMDLPLQIQSIKNLPFFAPHFVNDVLNQTPYHQKKIVTTLDLPLQTALEHVTSRYLSRKKSLGVYNAAVLLIDTRDMSVKSMIGSANFFNSAIEGQINGTHIKRSPGSTLKPFVYGLAIDQGLIHPDTVLKDVPHSFGHYNPENFDYDFVGPIHAKDALILSRNIPAIFLASQLKHPDLYDLLRTAHVSHLKSEQYYGFALTLGGAEVTMQELATLYAALANDGVWQPIHTHDNEKLTASERLLSPEASFLILDMLKNTPPPDESSFISEKLKNKISWKTGTSSGYRDAWSVGLVGPYVLAVWIGNFDNTANHAFVGKNIAAPLFFELASALQQAKGNIPSLIYNMAALNLKQIPVCKASGMLPTRYCTDTELTWFIPDKSPIKTDTIYREVAIDKKTGLRTCHFDQNTEFKIYEFWPSDLLQIFKQAGIQRRTPPPFDTSCSMISSNGFAPQIISPQTDVSYIVRLNSSSKLPLSAVTDADVTTLYWFLNNTFLAKSERDQPFIWNPKPGKYLLRVVDDHGRSDAREVEIKFER